MLSNPQLALCHAPGSRARARTRRVLGPLPSRVPLIFPPQVAYLPTVTVQVATFIRPFGFPSAPGGTQPRDKFDSSPFHNTIDMNAVNDQDSVMANAEVQVVQDVMISRYFTAAGSVVLMYDAILTMEDEVSGF